jgi:SOS response regulatory protein OraA/RecX
MGYAQDEITAHGFRSSASTILNERGVNPDVIEAALGHHDENAIRRAYNRATYWPERVKLMQTWANMLEESRNVLSRNIGLHNPSHLNGGSRGSPVNWGDLATS